MRQKLLKYPLWLLILPTALVSSCEQTTLGEIEFFGYKGLHTDAIRNALPFREGDKFPPSDVKSPDELKQIVSERIARTIGHEPTDVSFVCCDSHGRFMAYIGLRGDSSQSAVFNPAPQGDIRMPEAIVKLRAELDDLWMEAVMKGMSAEDDSQGYSLTNYPPARKKELELRDFALNNKALLFDVVRSSSDAQHRAIAAQALGYGRQSHEQVDALVHASFDADAGVRNDAIRALEVLAGAKPGLAQWVPVEAFIPTLNSETWSDRNKATLLMECVTRSRDAAVLRELRAGALDSLIEMASWHNSGHAFSARVLLGRIAGIKEDPLREMAAAGKVDAILTAVKNAP
jgi:hypothetical protein